MASSSLRNFFVIIKSTIFNVDADIFCLTNEVRTINARIAFEVNITALHETRGLIISREIGRLISSDTSIWRLIEEYCRYLYERQSIGHTLFGII